MVEALKDGVKDVKAVVSCCKCFAAVAERRGRIARVVFTVKLISHTRPFEHGST